MSHHNHRKFKNESQDARRNDKHNVTHPDDQIGKPLEKSDQHHGAHSHSNKRKI